MKNILLTIALLSSLPGLANTLLGNIDKTRECALKASQIPGTQEQREAFFTKCFKTDTEQQPKESLFNTRTKQQSKEIEQKNTEQRLSSNAEQRFLQVARKCAERSGIPYSYELIELKNKMYTDLSPEELSFKKCMNDNGLPLDEYSISINISKILQ